jgi:hypothetical protein
MAKQVAGKSPAPSSKGIIRVGGREVIIHDPHTEAGDAVAIVHCRDENFGWAGGDWSASGISSKPYIDVRQAEHAS